MDKLEELRKEIDLIDQQIAELYNKRLSICENIGKVKKQYNLPILNIDREQEVIDKNLQYVDEKHREGYKKVIQLIMDESKKVQ